MLEGILVPILNYLNVVHVLRNHPIREMANYFYYNC
jgi:hypothetical protein